MLVKFAIVVADVPGVVSTTFVSASVVPAVVFAAVPAVAPAVDTVLFIPFVDVESEH